MLPVTIADAKSLTLIGTEAVAAVHGFDAAADTYTGLGNITLGGANTELIIQSATPAKITLAGNIDGGGIITANTDAAINGTIGNTNPAAQISIGASTLSLGGAVIKTTTAKLTDAGSVLTLTNAVLAGAIDNTTGCNNKGIVNLNGTLSQVAWNIGNTNSLATINVGADTAILDGAVIKATTTKLTDDASVLIFTNSVVVTGAIDNTGNANKGVVIFIGDSRVTDNIGSTAALAEITQPLSALSR